MTICVGYFEASQPGTAPAVMTVSGYVSPKDGWRNLEERWPQVLRHEGLVAFNGQDFGRGTGEFAAGWVDNEPRRARFIETLARLTERHVWRAFSCSVPLDDYTAINETYRFAETASGPYGLCAAHIIARVQLWMAEQHPDDLTLFVFEDGEVDHREIRRVLRGEGVDKGEPVQLWPRQWTDERGRSRYLRPFEACDLLALQSDRGIGAHLLDRFDPSRELLGRTHLLQICDTLAIARRARSTARELV